MMSPSGTTWEAGALKWRGNPTCAVVLKYVSDLCGFTKAILICCKFLPSLVLGQKNINRQQIKQYKIAGIIFRSETRNGERRERDRAVEQLLNISLHPYGFKK